MSYLHIPNLYRPEAQKILDFKTVYVLEKIHGTSAHVAWRDGAVRLFPGGESLERFSAIFGAALPSVESLAERFRATFADAAVAVYGEAYGGKCQGMSKTYGPTLSFVAFDVKAADKWLAVPQAADVCAKLGMPFVWWDLVEASVQSMDAARDRDSEQAKRNGIVEPRIMEGVVIRPPFEVALNNGERLIAKHKRPEFAERKTIPNVDPAAREIMENAQAVADEWVTPMRLSHVLDKLGNPSSHKDIAAVVAAMVEDVTREASGEIVDDKAVRRAISGAAVKLYKAKIEAIGGVA